MPNKVVLSMKLPTAELWGILMSKATEATLIYPNRSRAAGYNYKINKVFNLMMINLLFQLSV